mgnify:CR=1 FL=1
MAVRVNVKKDLRRVPVRVKQMTKLGQYALANQVHADSNRYAPFRTGDLRNQSTITLDGKSIIWHVPYARAQYYGYVGKGRYPVRRYTTAGTGPKWDEKAKAIHLDSWIRVAKRAMK